MEIAASFILGGMVGLIPLLLGLMLKQAGLGRVGFLFCIFLGFLTGLPGPIVVAAGFVVGIVVSWNRGRPSPDTDSGTAKVE
jgi:hypothetical protein